MLLPGTSTSGRSMLKRLTRVSTSPMLWVNMARVGLPVDILPFSASRAVVTGTLASPVAVADNP